MPFQCRAGGLVLIFTALLVLLAEDHLKDSKVLGEQQLRLASYQWRFVGLSEMARTRASMAVIPTREMSRDSSYHHLGFTNRSFGVYILRLALPPLHYVLLNRPTL